MIEDPRDRSGTHEARAPDSRAWNTRREKGSMLALRFLVWGIRALGYGPLRFLVAPIALYYCLFAPSARRASMDYLRRVHTAIGSEASIGWRDTYRHVHQFAAVILDRLAMWAGGSAEFDIEIKGLEHAEALAAERRGTFLIGAHLGCFDILRVLARESDIPVNVVVYTGNAERINRAFEALDPTLNLRVISMEAGSATSFEIRRCIERGEFVAMLGDRSRPDARHRTSTAEFLGSPAPFPQGPFLLPLILEAPVLLIFALRVGPRRYVVHMEPFDDGGPVPSALRVPEVEQRVERFAARLEHHCKRVPLQWFNFFDFWSQGEHPPR